MKNLWGKYNAAGYMTCSYMDRDYGRVTVKVLKAYKSRRAELDDKYSRWMTSLSYVDSVGNVCSTVCDTYFSIVVLDFESRHILNRRLIAEEAASIKKPTLWVSSLEL
jgi:hypothetical protein